MSDDNPKYNELERHKKYLKKELDIDANSDLSRLDIDNDIDFHDLFDINEVQKIQDMFAEATGVASIITTPNGIPITKPSNFCRLCIDIIRKTEKGLKNCYHSDAVIGKQNIGGAIYQPCLSGGLWDGGASISVGGKHIANWLIGQVKNENLDERKMELYAREIGADEIEFKKALDEVPVMSIEKFKKISDTLFFFANELSQKAYQNILQNRMIEELQKKEEELIKAKEKAEESDRLKTIFLQNMSHEIRTPMNAIMGFSSLIPENFNKLDKLEQFSKIIDQRCNDLLDIINDILDLSKIESGQSDLNIEVFNIKVLFEELDSFFRAYQNRTNKKHLELLIPEIDKSDLLVKTDRVKLRQILINLISNAFKFTETGSVKFGCNKIENKLQFYVSDTGVGIPKEKFDYIFERFAQLKNSNIQNIGGTGLGLPIVKALVKLLGGHVWLESEYNKGTTFYFDIAYVSGVESDSLNSKSIKPTVNKIRTTTILIVEDDIYNSMYLQEILHKYFENIFTVGNGKDAINFARNNAVDVILMDIRLPDITGYEATKEILYHKPEVKIIAQTAYAAADEHQKAIKNGCVDYISKPTKQELLLTVINRHLEQ